jgi:NAD(P)-dependent dehydrogenase (short-subunit alcohol dehydrogenase family)
MSNQIALVTGAAGFVGFHVARRILQSGQPIRGLDNPDDYYDPELKQGRLRILENNPSFELVKLDLADRGGIKALFAAHRFSIVIHVAAGPACATRSAGGGAFRRRGRLGARGWISAIEIDRRRHRPLCRVASRPSSGMDACCSRDERIAKHSMARRHRAAVVRTLRATGLMKSNRAQEHPIERAGRMPRWASAKKMISPIICSCETVRARMAACDVEAKAGPCHRAAVFNLCYGPCRTVGRTSWKNKYDIFV